jgi:exonuclease VII large subunit
MAENDKGFRIRKLFFREAGTSSPDTVNQKSGSQPVQSVRQDDYIGSSGAAYSGASDQSLVEDFVNRLQKLIDSNNQSGFDFLEFTESLFEEKQNPDKEVYKTVYRIAQKIDKSLTTSRLLESARYYKDLVQSTADAEISKGQTKKQGLQGEKDTEKNNLESNLQKTRSRIQELSRQIQELQNQEITLNGQLMAIDQKYETRFRDIDRKLWAIKDAKEQVISSIVDIESGIKTNLS